MYNTAIPVMFTAKTYNREKILADLRLTGANRVFLAIAPIEYNAHQNDIFDSLATEIKYFKDNGIEAGVWFWAFWINGDCPFTPITSFGGYKSGNEKCPADPEFLDYMAENLRRVARTNPDLIMFDDDLRLGFLDSGYGCVCEHHLKLMSEYLGEEVSADGYFAKAFEGKKNKYRSAYLYAAGESLKNYCVRMRKAVDEINPAIRMGACSCLSVWDLDGVDSYTLAKLLAGSTKPFVRLIGAPYWGAKGAWKNRIENVVELERMERAWYDGKDIEIFSEGDVYPRPRFTVPAAHLEIFDTVLRADGNFDGILKYMLDYTSKMEYERGYIKRHLENQPAYEAIDRIFAGKKACGIRVYEAMRKLEDADFTDFKVNTTYIQNTFFCIASRYLSEHTLPSVYDDNGVCGISFGENARHLPDSAFEKPLIIDMTAAKILTEQGIDVGVIDFGEKCGAELEYFIDEDDYIAPYCGDGFTRKITLKFGAKVLSEFVNGDDKHPAVYTYKNADGNMFMVYNYAADLAEENLRRTYYRPMQIVKAMESFGVTLPAVCFGNPDLYMLCKKDEKSMAIGLWNCFADSCTGMEVLIDGEYKNAEFIGCNGKLSGNTITIEKISAFEFCFIHLTK